MSIKCPEHRRKRIYWHDGKGTAVILVGYCPDTLAHPADLSKIVPAKGWPVAYPVGMDCAKIIGLEWTTEQQPLET